MEAYKRWEAVQGIEWPCAGVEISNSTDALAVRLEFSKVLGGGERDLLLALPWGYVVGFASWQEFCKRYGEHAGSIKGFAGRMRLDSGCGPLAA